MGIVVLSTPGTQGDCDESSCLHIPARPHNNTDLPLAILPVQKPLGFTIAIWRAVKSFLKSEMEEGSRSTQDLYTHSHLWSFSLSQGAQSPHSRSVKTVPFHKLSLIGHPEIAEEAAEPLEEEAC